MLYPDNLTMESKTNLAIGKKMNNKIIGAILITIAGLTTIVGIVGAQIANAIVVNGFYSGQMTGMVPPGPDDVHMNSLIIIVSLVTALLGLYFLLDMEKSGKLIKDRK